MDVTKYPQDTQSIIRIEEEIHEDLKRLKYEDMDLSGLKPVPGIDVLYFMACMCPESVCYGSGTGMFVYKDGRVFRFSYNIHTTYSKGPHLSNRMTGIEQVILEEKHGIAMTRHIMSMFGKGAFWMHTPMDCLDDEGKALRMLMGSIQEYCREMDLCGKLRKTDRLHEEWEKGGKKA